MICFLIIQFRYYRVMLSNKEDGREHDWAGYGLL